jgi:hypothetical protein
VQSPQSAARIVVLRATVDFESKITLTDFGDQD